MMKPKFIPNEEIKSGQLVTVYAESTAAQQAIVASGRIFRVREVAFPFVFADYYLGQNRWTDSMWQINLEQGANLIALTPEALYRFKPEKKKTKKK